MKRKNTVAVFKQFKRTFSIFDYPESIKQDNGWPFISSKFRDYYKSANTQDSSILREQPQSNAVVENFNRLLNKLVGTAKFNQKYWRNVLCIFLHTFSSHVITGK